MTSSPLRPGVSLTEELDYYKKQYEQLETDLADFQSSSKELEEQLERDIEAAEKNERKLKQQVEKLHFEVEEWKTKHKQAKAEANSAQAVLQKEITGLRESNRGLSGKLREIEVQNDEHERAARNTESSLEDLESKYHAAVEKAVMDEEDIKIGEQERESLRIETQRLRDELGDLKVESEITIEKLRLADHTIERMRSRKPSPLAVESLRAKSPGSEVSGVTPSSTTSSPPTKSDSALTPPSPPLSDAPALTLDPRNMSIADRKSLAPDSAAATRTSLYGPRPSASRHSRGTSIASSISLATDATKSMGPPVTKVRPTSRPSVGTTLPRSDSLHQVKALRSRMQKIEDRVHSARSKLPPPGTRTPTKRSPMAAADSNMPASVTMRRSMKRPSGSVASSLLLSEQAPELEPRRRESHVKRLSYGIPRPSAVSERPTSSEGPRERAPSSLAFERPSSRALADRAPSSTGKERPASRAMMDRPPSAMERASSRALVDRPPSAMTSSRPNSRASMASAGYERPSSRAGARTPLLPPTSPLKSLDAPISPSRPRSSLADASGVSSKYATIQGPARSGHRPSASVSEIRRRPEDASMRSSVAGASRRTTLEKGSGLPMGLFGTPKGRESVGGAGKAVVGRRTSLGFGTLAAGARGEMRPPPTRRKVEVESEDLGETF